MKVYCSQCENECSDEDNVCPVCSHPLKRHSPPVEVGILHVLGVFMMIGGVVWFVVAIGLAKSYMYSGEPGVHFIGGLSTVFLGLLTHAAGTTLALLSIIASKR